MKLSLRHQRGFTLVELIRLIAHVAVVGLVSWVIIHFLCKFW